MNATTEAAPAANQRCIGRDFSGKDVLATFTVTEAGKQVRFEGIVNPVNRMSIRPTVQLLLDASGGWYVESSLVSPGFRFDGGWDIPFNAPGIQGKRRLFADKDELKRILVEAGYVVEVAECARPTPVANLASVGAASAAILEHTNALGIEGDERTQLWHLVASLHEFAAAQGISLANVVEDVRLNIKLGEMGLPAALSALRNEERPA